MLVLLAIIGCLSLFAGLVIMAGSPEMGGIKYVAVGALLLLIWSCIPAIAQEHKHPPQDEAIHQKFYRNWNMPDNRAVSCCHDEDCFPAQAKNVNGTWYARKDDGDEWIEIPRNKVDIGLPDSRDPPDSRAHLCGRKYTFMGASSGFTVFCFTAGAGI